MSSVVLTEIHGRVGLIRINRPEAMNALNNEVVDGIGAAIDAFEADENIGCIVITGNEKAFAAGAECLHGAEVRVPRRLDVTMGRRVQPGGGIACRSN